LNNALKYFNGASKYKKIIENKIVNPESQDEDKFNNLLLEYLENDKINIETVMKSFKSYKSKNINNIIKYFKNYKIYLKKINNIKNKYDKPENSSTNILKKKLLKT
jgi:hypothetical protein